MAEPTTRKKTRKKSTAKRGASPAKKTAAKRAATRKTSAKKSSLKKPTRKYSPAASESVGTELDELKAGTLRSGGSGKKVTSRKQAIAIGLSEARAAGKKVPPNPNRPAGKKKS
jgi:hypothetical protein